jgi:hypothetical protein
MSKPTSLRLPDKLFGALTAEARRRGVPFPDFTRLVLERGLWLESTKGAMRESHAAAIYETRNLLRRLVVARSHKDALEARAEAEQLAREERT